MHEFTAEVKPQQDSVQASTSSSSSAKPDETESKKAELFADNPIELHKFDDVLSAVVTAAKSVVKKKKKAPASKPVPVGEQVKKLGQRFCLADIEKPNLDEHELADL